jgi:hypothetical protein
MTSQTAPKSTKAAKKAGKGKEKEKVRTVKMLPGIPVVQH